MKEEIIETSLRQFLKHGIRKMTVQKLIGPMGISTKTVYKYFNDKEELLKYCLVKHYSELAKDFDIRGSSNPVITILKLWHNAMELDFGVNHIFYHDLNYYYPRLQDSILHRFFKKRFSKLSELMEKGVKQGYFRNDIVPAMIPEVTSALYSSITRTDQFKKYKLTPGVLIQNTIEAYLRGVCTEKGLKELKRNYSLITK
jgi:AcrR family transcriptional regulator